MSMSLRIKLTRKLEATAKGQSLVEMAIIAPILIFMLIGVFEVGWVLRGYLTLVNANRETARFAIRPGYLDFSIKDAFNEQVGYGEVYSRALFTLADQLPEDFENNGAMIISHLVVDTAWPCEPPANSSDPWTCTCEEFINPASNYNAAENFTKDDLVLHPLAPGFGYYSRTFTSPTFLTVTTHISYVERAEELIHQNNKFNCELIRKGGVPSANNVVITELFYKQPQLFGFPLISNPFTDPVPLYSHTTMRLVTGARSGESADTIGPVCAAYPWSINSTVASTWPISTTKNDIQINWIKWDATASDSAGLLLDQIKYPRMSLNSYRSPGGETVLAAQGQVQNLTISSLSTEERTALQNALTVLEGLDIIVPVLNSNTIQDFIKIRILPGSASISPTPSGQPVKINALNLGSVLEGNTAGNPEHCLASPP